MGINLGASCHDGDACCVSGLTQNGNSVPSKALLHPSSQTIATSSTDSYIGRLLASAFLGAGTGSHRRHELGVETNEPVVNGGYEWTGVHSLVEYGVCVHYGVYSVMILPSCFNVSKLLLLS